MCSTTQASVLSDVESLRLLNTSLLASTVPKNLFPGEADVRSISVETGLLLGGFGTGALKTSFSALPGLQSSANDVDKLPILPQLPTVYFQLTFPRGISVDTQLFPKISASTVSTNYWALGVKWNYLAALMPMSKVESSIRLGLHSFSLSKGSEYDLRNSGYGLLHTIGKRWSWASLWFGYGFATGSLDVNINSSKASISESPRSTGLHLSLGGVLEGGTFTSGIEWANIIGINTVSLKIGFRI